MIIVFEILMKYKLKLFYIYIKDILSSINPFRLTQVACYESIRILSSARILHFYLHTIAILLTKL